MRRWRLVLGVALTLAVPAAVALGDGSRDVAMGGGQVVLHLGPQAPDNGQGPGTTIAFTAQQVEPGSEVADGEVEEVDRTHSADGTGSVFHGKVFCMIVNGNEAVIAYRPRQENAPSDEFHRLFVRDNGEGATDDLIVFQQDPDPGTGCVLDTTATQGGELVRGNVQVEDNTP